MIALYPAVVAALFEQTQERDRKKMKEKIRITNVAAAEPFETEGGGKAFQWSFEIASVDGPLIHEKRHGGDYYNGIPFWQIKNEAERMAREANKNDPVVEKPV